MGGRGNGGARNSATSGSYPATAELDSYSSILGTRDDGSTIDDRMNKLLGGTKVRGLNKSLVNPEFNMFDPKTSTNCALCTTASALRLMGYDVEAMERDTTWRGPATVFDIDYSNKDNFIAGEGGRTGKPRVDTVLGEKRIVYKGKAIKGIDMMPASATKAAKMIEDKVKSWGNGSFGEISVTWKRSGKGHSIFVMNKGNSMVVYDSQSGKKIGNLSNYLKDTTISHTFLTRLDNATVKKSLDDYNLSYMVKRRKSK